MGPHPSERLRWLLLVHHLPARPLYLRAQIHRRLEQAGAIALKRSVYALPERAGCREELERIAEAANAGGGRAHVCRARFLDPGTDALLVESSRSAREEDYESLAAALHSLRGSRDAERGASARQRFQSIEKIDFFEAPGRRRVDALLTELENRLERRRAGRPHGRAGLVGRSWSTRRGVQIDRIASAWLIRRFIDPDARFRFVDPSEERPADELRFDMVGGDFSHEEDRCTFETLVLRTGLSDPALAAVAEIVHDIDLKDGKFGRPEARGVEQVLLGMLADTPSDRERLEKGYALFDDLYRSFTRTSARLRSR